VIHGRASRELAIGAGGLATLALVILLLRAVQQFPNPAIAALLLLLVILITATAVGVRIAIAVSVIATAAFNFFLLPPFYTFTLADPQNWVALFVFLLTAIIASQLSGRARGRAVDALARQRDLERLYALSRALLLAESRAGIFDVVARHIAETFELSAVAVYDHRTGLVARGGPDDLPEIEERLRDVVRQSVPFRDEFGTVVTTVRLGGEPIGGLAVHGAELNDTVLQSIANLAAISLERVHGQEAAARAEAARESGELRAAVLDSVAHEFKTPLTSIKAASTDLLSAIPGEAREHELVRIVAEEADRLQAVVTDAVQMLRIEAGGFAVHRERHNLAKLLASLCAELSSRLDGYTLKADIPPSMTVDADGDLLRLALRHLLDNAAKYSPPGSMIQVLATENASVEIAVRNSGSVIPERDQAHIFDRFYRGLQARLVPGSGMGLAIVKQIARAHGGTVHVSSSQHAGTELTMSLPRGDGPA
jgi:two-component system sensor histidine kinase KdpD